MIYIYILFGYILFFSASIGIRIIYFIAAFIHLCYLLVIIVIQITHIDCMKKLKEKQF